VALPYGINSPIKALVGPDAAKPDLALAQAGYFYFATDTRLIYQARPEFPVPIEDPQATIWVEVGTIPVQL
jgi:hypothetical protein